MELAHQISSGDVTDGLRYCFNAVIVDCKANRIPQATPEHLLLEIVRNAQTFAETFSEFRSSIYGIMRELQGYVDDQPRVESGNLRAQPTWQWSAMLERASKERIACGDGLIDVEHMLLALCTGGEARIIAILSCCGVSIERLREVLLARLAIKRAGSRGGQAESFSQVCYLRRPWEEQPGRITNRNGFLVAEVFTEGVWVRANTAQAANLFRRALAVDKLKSGDLVVGWSGERSGVYGRYHEFKDGFHWLYTFAGKLVKHLLVEPYAYQRFDRVYAKVDGCWHRCVYQQNQNGKHLVQTEDRAKCPLLVTELRLAAEHAAIVKAAEQAAATATADEVVVGLA